MRLKLVLLLCGMGSVMASPMLSQQNSLNVSYENIPVTDILEDLKTRTGYDFFYQKGLIPSDLKGTVVLENASLNQILDKVLGTNGLSYQIRDRHIIIGPARSVSAQTDGVVITGTVFDMNRKPLEGASVMVKGTRTGTMSGADGKFVLNTTAAQNMVLQFTFLGKKSVEIPYTGQTNLTVTLMDETMTIEQVVITGFFERKAESFTGSAASYTGAQLKNISTQNVFEALRSLDPSMSIISNDLYGSDPNRLPDIDIRGKTSIVDPRDNYTTDPNQPLYIMDGFEVSAQEVKNLNVNRIASLTILKDAASTAIYGAKAANGVIVIETHKPQQGELRFTYSGSFSATFADLSDYNLMNASEKLAAELASGVFNNAYSVNDYNRKDLYNSRLELVLSGVDTYWLKVPLRTGVTHMHDIYIDGGDESFTFGLGVNYNNTQGVMKKSGNNGVGLTLDMSYRTKNEKFRFQNKFTTNYSEAWNPPVSFATYAETNPYYVMPKDGDQPRWLENREYFDTTTGMFIVRSGNPLYNETRKHINDDKNLTLRNNFYAEWRPVSGLMVASRFSIATGRAKAEFFKSPFHTDFEDVNVLERGLYKKDATDFTNFSGDLRVIYNKTLGGVHNVFLNGTFQAESETTIFDNYSTVGFADDIIPYPSFSMQYPPEETPGYNRKQMRSINVFLQTGYSYDNRYSFDFTLRRDGSSNFGRDNLFTTTWSAGAAWNLHREAFLENSLELLKLRFTIGKVGNSKREYATATTYRYDTKSNLFGSGVYVKQFGSYGLDWEKTLDINLGIDFTTNNRFFSMTADVYRKTTDPLIIRYDVAASTGRSGLLMNSGRNTIEGFTFAANLNVINRPADRFIWGIGINGNAKTSEFSKMDNLDKLNDDLREIGSLSRYYNGGSQYSIWAAPSAGIDPSTGNELFVKPDGTYTWTWDKSYEMIVGNTQPDLQGRINSTLQYKGWHAGVYLHYIIGQDQLNNVLRQKIEGLSQSDMLSKNQDRRALYDRWKSVGDNSRFKRITDLTGNSQSRISSRFLQTKSWLAGESISLGYSFEGHSWLDKAGIENVSVNMILNDIFNWSSVKQERGILYPYARTASMSVNITF